MRRCLLALVPMTLALFAAGCATRYVVVPGLPKSDLQVVVFTEDQDQGAELLEWLAEHGYDNKQNHVAFPTDNNGNAVRYGAAPAACIDEIAAYIEGRFEVAVDRDRAFKPSDYSVFVHLDAAARARVAPGRGDVRVVIFTDDKDRGELLLDSLRGRGFTNDENYVTDEPNDEPNVKWGAASEEMVDNVCAVVQSLLGVELDRQHSFEEDDNDLFVNLPFDSAGRMLTRADFDITVFCDNDSVGQNLLARLAALGYSSDENEVLSGANDTFNIKYGGLPSEMLDELAGLVEKEFKAEVERLEEFARSSRQVFINIPATE